MPINFATRLLLLQVSYSLNRFVKFIGPGLLMSIAYVVSWKLVQGHDACMC
jgi:Mn2+/Fe2+ NRAMP family transporter